MPTSKRTTLSGLICAALAAAAVSPLQAAEEEIYTGEITVTGTREAESKAETPATVNSVGEQTVDETRPAHPSEIMNKLPGVYVNVTNGEGHMTAIRQPLSTQPLYLYLEDGVPTRSTGFFNHNAMYEVNVPQSGGIEVFKGPGTALYGSDAVGGIINVLTRPSPLEPELKVDLEAGEHGWYRLLATGGNSWDDDGVRGDLNITHTDGWRDATEYDRQSAGVRWDRILDSGATLKTVLNHSNIDQQTAGSSRLLKDDYENNPTLNYTPISYREVRATRLSVAYEQESGDSLISITPYLRDDFMELLPNWSLSYDPVVYETSNQSVGLLAKYRRDFEPWNSRLIVGLDLDYSPGDYDEWAIDPTKVGNIYTDYTIGDRNYQYDVSYTGVAPYVHVETSPVERLRLNAGLRFDWASYDYDNKLGELQTGSHRRPGSTTVDFNHFSPKVGATYQFAQDLSGFAAYRHGFRVPSEGQLFRQGQAIDTVDLEPVKVDSFELGIRGKAFAKVDYELSAYYMTKRDDILSYTHPDGSRETMNAGETLHRGIEAALHVPLTTTVDLDLAYSYAKHTYEDWQPQAGVDYSGNEMESAPRSIGNVRLTYRPGFLNGGFAQLEWEHLGSYWMDQANTAKYDGHDLLNLRADYKVGDKLTLYARLMNLTDERYATAASYSPAAWGRPEKFEYAPGMPRTFYAGFEYRFW